MYYIKITDGNIETYSLGQLKNDNPQVSFPAEMSGEQLALYNVYAVVTVEPPPFNYLTQDCNEVDPVQVDGVWTQQWEVVDKTESSAATNVRVYRNSLLSDCDWTQGKDIPDAVSTPWAVYRQELRDVPEQEGFPYNVVWPNPPA